MDSLPPHHPDLVRLRLAAAWLATGRIISRTSLILLALSLCAAFWGNFSWPGRCVLLGSILCGIVQTVYAVRVRFDYQILTDWIHLLETAPPPSLDTLLGTVDQGLAEMGLHSSPVPSTTSTHQPPRPLADRIRGSCRLLNRQATALACQCGGLVFIAAEHLYNTPLQGF